MDIKNNAACVQCLHSEHAEGPPFDEPVNCYYTVAATLFGNLLNCFCSLITAANKPSLNDAEWTLEVIQHLLNIYIVIIC